MAKATIDVEVAGPMQSASPDRTSTQTPGLKCETLNTVVGLSGIGSGNGAVDEARANFYEAAPAEESFRLMFERSLDVGLITSLATDRIVEVNEHFTHLSGFSRDEVLGKTAVELGLWHDPSEREAIFREVRKHGFVEGIEVTNVTRNGEVIDLLVSAVVVPFGGEQCVLSSCRNISRLKATERKLRQSEAALRGIFDAMMDPVALAEADNRGAIIEVNSEFLRVHGFTREQVIGRSPAEIGLWTSPEQLRILMRGVRARGSVRNMEAAVRDRRGGTLPCLLSATLVEHGGRPCVLCIVRDISDRKETERKLLEHAAALERILDTSHEAITVNRLSDGAYVNVSRSFQGAGFERGEVLGKSPRDLGLWADSSRLSEFMRLIRQHGRVVNMEANLRKRDGSVAPCLISAAVTNINGEPCIVSFTRDISRIKRTENELRAAREAALAASRAKSEFLSSMSHEIRTPMNAVLGMADLLWETALTPIQRRYLETAISNGNALLDLINSILDLAKIESGRLSLESVNFDLGEIVDKLADSFALRAHEKRLELAVRVAPDVPTALVGDPVRLRQVLVNLVGNAVKFTEEGEVVLSVVRDPHGCSPGSLMFTVRDSGVGIASEKLAVIFRSFTQADSSTTRKYGGSGLGLAIVDRLVALMGGRIWVESAVGEGSTFSFTVNFQVQSLALPVPPELDLRGVSVLAVDDNATNRLILREMLTARGARISEAASAREGIEAIEAAHRAGRPFKLLLVDCRMPEMDGFEMVRELRSHPKHNDLVIMMLSSNGLSGTLGRMKDLGLNHYMVKPVKRRELYEAIAQALAPGSPGAGEPSRVFAAAGNPHPVVLERALRILLADDSADNRLLIRAYLGNTPYQLDEAENGRIAIDKFKAANYDLVLMDIQMPVLDGYQAVREIRHWERTHRHRHTPIVALTASALDGAVRRAKEAGCDLHVSKPVKRATLLEAILTVEKNAMTQSEATETKAENTFKIEVDPELRDLIPGFLERKRAEADKIIDALSRNDFATIASLAHRARGEGGSYGFPTVSEIGAALERAAQEKNLDATRNLAQKLSDYLAYAKSMCRPSP